MDASLEREITAAQHWQILTDLMDEFERVHGRPLHTFEEFQAWLTTASGRRAMRRRIGAAASRSMLSVRISTGRPGTRNRLLL